MSLLTAVAVALALTVLPGYLLTRAFAPQSHPLVHVAAGVPVSAGLIYITALWLSLWHVNVGWSWVTVAVAVAYSRWRLSRHGHPIGSRWCSVWRWDLAGSAVGAAALLTTWLAGMPGLAAVPPHDDGYHHGYFVARIAETGSIDPSIVTTIDPMSPQRVVAFYPFATHVQAALVRLVTGVDVPTAYNVVILLGTALSLPVGLLVLTRRLVPRARWAGPAAALMGVAIPALSYASSWSGLFPQMLGIASVAGVALLADDHVSRSHRSTLALAALGLAGLLGIHTTAGAFAVPVALALSFTTRSRLSWLQRLRRGLAWVATALVLTVPMLLLFAGGWSERQGVPIGPPMSLGESVASLVLLREFVSGPAPLAFTALAWLGLVRAVRRRRLRTWCVLIGIMALLSVAAGIWRTPLVLLITSPWYSMQARISPFLTFLLVPLAASVAETLKPSRRHGRSALVTVAVLATFGGAIVGGLRSGAVLVHDNYRDFSVVGGADKRAFAWLAGRVRPGERVLNGRADGSQWMFPLSGVVSTNWAKLNAPAGEAAERDWLTRHAAEGWGNDRVAADLERLKIRYAYVGDNLFPNTDNLLDGGGLAASPYWSLAFSSDGVRVFELSTNRSPPPAGPSNQG